MSDEAPKPPGVCDECLANNLAILYERASVVHCAHRDVGAIGCMQPDGSLMWITYSPITRDAFEANVTATLRDMREG